MFEQQKATQTEIELKKPIDKKKPWGIVAESWAGDKYMDSLDKGLTYCTGSSRRD